MLRIRLPVDLEGELHERAKAFLALAERLFRRLSLGQIDDESDKLVSAFFDGCGAKHDGHSAAVFPEVLLLDWRPQTSRLMLQEPLCVPLAPVRGRQSPSSVVRPASRSPRSYPTMRRKASLASRIWPSKSAMKIPTTFASTKRRIFASRS